MGTYYQITYGGRDFHKDDSLHVESLGAQLAFLSWPFQKLWILEILMPLPIFWSI